jgi:ABC-type dipeptide/oligopeptide/nickel transport system permease subunit
MLIAIGALVGLTQLIAQLDNEPDLLNRFHGPSRRHLFGTDQFGRDVLLLLLTGMRTSLGLAGATVGLSMTIGVVAATVAASGNFRRLLLSGVSDVVLALPTMVVALIAAAAIGTRTTALILVLTGVGWTPYFRLVSAQITVAQQLLYVEAARAAGATPNRILTRHIMPNVATPLVALGAARFGHAVISVSSLSFLGIGPPPPSPEWGATLAAAQPHVENAPWAVAAPSLAILMATSATFAMGRWVNRQLTSHEG